MNADDFVLAHARNAVISKGYDESDAEQCAQWVLTRWRRNEFKRATDFVQAALDHAKQHYQIRARA